MARFEHAVLGEDGLALGAPVGVFAEDQRQHVVQYLRQGRLGQVAGEAQFLEAAGVALVGGRGVDDQGQPGQLLILEDFSSQLGAVHARHQVVEYREVGGQAGTHPLPQQLQGFLGIARNMHLHAELLQLLAQHMQVDAVIVHHQGVTPLKTGRGLVAAFADHRQLHREVEAGTLAGLAFDADFAAHHLHQLTGDRQAQPGAAVLARGGAVGLGEGIEQLVDLLLGDADAGVDDRELQAAAIVPVFQRHHLQDDMAVVGELDGVADQVHQDLAQAAGIAVYALRAVGGEIEHQLHLLVDGRGHQQVADLVGGDLKIEIQRLQLEPAGLDLGEVEDVVDDGQQGLAGLVDGGHIVGLLGIQRRLAQQLGHAQHAVHRGADLVAHGGEEFRLGAGGGLGLLLGLEQGLLDQLLLGDVGHDQGEVLLIGVVEQLHDVEGDRDFLLVDREQVGFAGPVVLGEGVGDGLVQQHAQLFLVVEQVAQMQAAVTLFVGNAEDVPGRLVERQDVAFEREGDHHVGAGLGDLQQSLLLLQHIEGIGDVVEGQDGTLDHLVLIDRYRAQGHMQQFLVPVPQQHVIEALAQAAVEQAADRRVFPALRFAGQIAVLEHLVEGLADHFGLLVAEQVQGGLVDEPDVALLVQFDDAGIDGIEQLEGALALLVDDLVLA